MAADIERALAVFFIAASCLGIIYLVVAIVCIYRFQTRRPPSGGAALPVTIFKPLRGSEPALMENLASFCDQDYPSFQILFGVRDADDSAITVVRRLLERYPHLDLELVVDARAHGVNPKISNVLNMVDRAKHDVYIVVDSDMRVERDYLRSVTAPLAEAGVGAVTCLYGGSPLAGLWSALGAMFVNDIFAPSVLVGIVLQKMRFTFGAAMAVRKDVLQRIGGFEALAQTLADDERLGRLVSAAGYRVALATAVVQDTIFEPTLAGLWTHELRWARTVRTSRPLGYAFFFITYPLPMAVFALVFSRNLVWGLSLLAFALILRVMLHYASLAALRAAARPAPWLIPIRDALALAEWVTCFFGRGVRWRDQDFRVDSAGRLVPVARERSSL